MFKSESQTLFDFFNSAGVAYYIPYYQRQYSWDTENVDKMLDDLSDGVRKICNQNDYVRFLGSVILWEEKEPKENLHYDSKGLITKIYNVIDGQQRISTLSILAILLSKRLEEMKSVLITYEHNSIRSIIIDNIANKVLELQEIYSTDVKKANVKPANKPIIIRAFNSLCNPVVDQWTLNGDYQIYYKSDIGHLTAEFIENRTVNYANIQNSKLKENVKRIQEWIIEIEQDSRSLLNVSQLLQQKDTVLEIVNEKISVSDIEQLDVNSQNLINGTVRIISIVSFLLKKTYLTVIESPSESLAFDMFQSINATGTPLTAIEVFKPQVVNYSGDNFGRSNTKKFLDSVDKFFDEQKTASEKEKLADELLLKMALVHNGKELGKRFSEQRDWLIDSYNQCNSDEQKENFIHWLSDVTAYWQHIYKPRRPNGNETNFKLVKHLVKLGLDNQDADLAALCIFYLKDASHAMSHYLLSLFYSKLLRAQGTDVIENAASEFLKICKACAAFFTLWSCALTGFPDQIYRELFNTKKENLSWFNGEKNQSSAFVNAHFKQALSDKKVFDINSADEAKMLWLKEAKSRLGYGINRKVCRFALFVSSHEKSPDMSSGNEGLMILGTPGSSQYLTCKAWHSFDYAEIEHIANQTKPANPKYFIDEHLYPGNSSVIDIVGNLTLLSKTANTSIYDEWAEKVFYYSTLTSLTPIDSVDLKKLANAQGIKTIPPKLNELAASTNYIANLAPLALRGNAGLPWNKEFVDKRTQRICELLFDDMVAWL